MVINEKFVKTEPKPVEMNEQEHFLFFVWCYIEALVFATRPVAAAGRYFLLFINQALIN